MKSIYMITSLNQYVNEANRTAAPAEVEEDLFHSYTGLSSEMGEVCDQLKRHFFYKLPLDLVNLREELGDVLWYIHLPIKKLYALTPETQESICNFIESGDPAIMEMTNSAVEEFIELQKTTLTTPMIPSYFMLSAVTNGLMRLNNSYMTILFTEMQRDDPSKTEEAKAEEFANALQELAVSLLLYYHSVITIARAFGFEPYDLMTVNINKLAARYPDKFTVEAATTRDLEAERKVLEA